MNPVGKKQCFKRRLGGPDPDSRIGETKLQSAVQRKLFFRRCEQKAAKLIDLAKRLDIEQFAWSRDEQMGGVSNHAPTISSPISERALSRNEYPMAAVVPMPECADNLMNVDDLRAIYVIMAQALIARSNMSIERGRLVNDRRVRRLGSYLLHLAVFLSLQCKRSATNCVSAKL